MKRIELTDILSSRLQWERQDTEKMLAALGNIAGEELSARKTLHIHGVGRLEARKIDDRMQINPSDGKTYLIPPKLVAKFTPDDALCSHLKNSKQS
jgi:DNA-binding protein HU-beta